MKLGDVLKKEREMAGIPASAMAGKLGMSADAYERIESSALSRVVVTDSIPLRRTSECIEVVGVAGMFADAIRRIATDASVSTLFVP